MKLKELKEKLDSTKGKKLPTVRELREDISILVVKESLDDGELCVYRNGFAAFWTKDHQTIFRVDEMGSYTYSSNTERTCIAEHEFDEMDWQIRVLMEAEERIEHSMDVMESRKTYSYDDLWSEKDAVMDQTEELQDTLFRRQKIEEIYGLLNPRQKEILQMRFIEERTWQEIASCYGVSFQAIMCSMNGIRKKIHKNLKNY